MSNAAAKASRSSKAALSPDIAASAEAQAELHQTLAQTIQLLEASLPANPNAVANRRAAARVEKRMREYFKALEDALPYDALDEIFLRNAKGAE